MSRRIGIINRKNPAKKNSHMDREDMMKGEHTRKGTTGRNSC